MEIIKHAAFVLLFLAALSNFSYAHTVTLNYAFRIGADKDNIIHVNDTDFNATQANLSGFQLLDKKFITAERGSTVFGMVFAGKAFLNASLNTTYSASEYLLQMKQGGEKNKFLVAFTNGTWRNVDSTINLERDKIPSKTFGDVVIRARENFPFFMRAEYESIDISNRVRWDGPVKIAIRHEGLVNGLANITFRLLSGG